MKLPPRLHKNSQRAQDSRSNPSHRKWVRGHACSVPGCTRTPIECAHVRIGTDGGAGLKPSDRWCISLCSYHHQEQHTIGEQAFEKLHSFNLADTALKFRQKSPHPFDSS